MQTFHFRLDFNILSRYNGIRLSGAIWVNKLIQLELGG